MPGRRFYFKGYDQQTPFCFYRMAFFCEIGSGSVAGQVFRVNRNNADQIETMEVSIDRGFLYY